MTSEIEKIIDEPEKKRFNPKYDWEDLKKAFALGHEKALEEIEKEVNALYQSKRTKEQVNKILEELKQRLEKLRGGKK